MIPFAESLKKKVEVGGGGEKDRKYERKRKEVATNVEEAVSLPCVSMHYARR